MKYLFLTLAAAVLLAGVAGASPPKKSGCTAKCDCGCTLGLPCTCGVEESTDPMDKVARRVTKLEQRLDDVCDRLDRMEDRKEKTSYASASQKNKVSNSKAVKLKKRPARKARRAPPRIVYAPPMRSFGGFQGGFSGGCSGGG